MKKALASIAAFFVLAAAVPAFAQGNVQVDGYYRRNGTYVQPYTRSAPDGNPYNNRTPSTSNPYGNDRGYNQPRSTYPTFLDNRGQQGRSLLND